MSSLKFGTSGLRGLVNELPGAPAYAHVRAFCEVVREDNAANIDNNILIGRDLRASSPEIARHCAQAISDAGFTPLDCGAVPTPALALAAMLAGTSAIMVTGSHIPEDRNGLNFIVLAEKSARTMKDVLPPGSTDSPLKLRQIQS